MKKIIVIFVILVIAIIAGLYRFFNFRQEKNELKETNLQYEYCYNKEIYGAELATIINKAIENNEKYGINRDEKGFYEENETNSIKIEIHITDNDTVYNMETFYMNDINRFVQNYNNIKFKCTKIEYHPYTGRIKYLYFEQITQ